MKEEDEALFPLVNIGRVVQLFRYLGIIIKLSLVYVTPSSPHTIPLSFIHFLPVILILNEYEGNWIRMFAHKILFLIEWEGG